MSYSSKPYDPFSNILTITLIVGTVLVIIANIF